MLRIKVSQHRIYVDDGISGTTLPEDLRRLTS